MKNLKKKVMSILISITLCFVAAFSIGCNDGQNLSTQIGEDTNDFVKLTWWTISNGGLTPNDFRDTEREMNKIFKEKINAEVTFKFIETNQFTSGMETKINAAEKFDICYTSNWTNDYMKNVGKEAFFEITDDDLAKYAPTIKSTFVPEVWKAIEVDGKKYAVINNQLIARGAAMNIRKDVLDPYAASLNKPVQAVIESIKTIEDYTPLLTWIKNQNPPITLTKDQIAPPIALDSLFYAAGYDALAGYRTPGAIAFEDGNCKVINQYDTDAFKNIIKTIGEWKAAGFYPADMISENLDPTTALMINTFANPAENRDVTGKPSYISAFGDRYWSTGAVQATMNAISTTSEHPARALKALELMYSDKVLFNLFAYGIEGTHYTMENEKVKTIPGANWTISSSFAMGNEFNKLLKIDQPSSLWTDIATINNTAKKSKALGFVFDPTSVQIEISNCNTFIDNNQLTLIYGILKNGETHEQVIKKFNDWLEAAGSNKVIKEMQRQIDTWRK